MKIDPKSKSVRLTLAKSEFRLLGELLGYAQDEKERNPVSWLMKPKALRKMLDSLLGTLHGLDGHSTTGVDDATKLSPEYQAGVLRNHEGLRNRYEEIRSLHEEYVERDLGLGPGALENKREIFNGTPAPDESAAGTGRRVYKGRR